MSEFKSKKFFYIFLGCFLFLDLLLGFTVLEGAFFNRLEVVFFDVGQGDAVLIKTPEGGQILIDGGPDSKILEKLGREMPFWDRSIETVILTHPDSDHLVGLIHVFKNFEVKTLIWTGQEKDTADFKEFQSALFAESAKVIKAEAGEEISFENGKIEIIFPFFESKQGKETNDFSIVSRLDYGEISFLLPGDIGLEVQREIFEKYPLSLDADILKVSHHGSKNSNSDFMIESISPELAVIQVAAKNRYGLPNSEALASLAKFANILRTDEKGNVKIITDGKSYKIKTAR